MRIPPSPLPLQEEREEEIRDFRFLLFRLDLFVLASFFSNELFIAGCGLMPDAAGARNNRQRKGMLGPRYCPPTLTIDHGRLTVDH